MTETDKAKPLLVTPDFTVATGQVEVNRCRLVVADAEINHLGLEFVGTEVDVIRPGEAVPAEGPFVLATTRAGDIHDGSRVLSDISRRFDTIVTERDGLVARQLLSDGNHAFGTLAKVTIGERLVALDFREPHPDDVLAGRFLDVVHDLISDQAEIAARRRGEIALARLLVDSLGAMDEVEATPQVPDVEPARTPPGDQKALVKLRREHDVLERKYQSLAASRLGRLTLRYWNLRKTLRKTSE